MLLKAKQFSLKEVANSLPGASEASPEMEGWRCLHEHRIKVFRGSDGVGPSR